MCFGRMGLVANEKEEHQVYREEGHELRMGGWHSVAFAVYLCNRVSVGPPLKMLQLERTLWPLLLDNALQDPIHRLTAHLASEHEKHFGFPRAPYQCGVHHTKALGD